MAWFHVPRAGRSPRAAAGAHGRRGETEAGDPGPAAGHEGGASLAKATDAAQTAATDEAVSHVVDEFFAGTRPSPEAGAQAVVDSVVSGVTRQAPPAAPAGAVTGDGLRTLGAMATPQIEIQPGSDFGARHQYNLGIAGVAVVALAAFVGKTRLIDNVPL